MRKIEKNGSRISMEKYVVAYIDILGSSEKMIKDDDCCFLNQMNELYHQSMKLVKSLQNNFNIKNIDIRIFSDNIIIARKISANENDFEESAMEAIVAVDFLSSAMQSLAFAHKILLRGGISIGDFYIDETFVYGNALIRAYNYENKVAVYPRIVMDKYMLTQYVNYRYFEHDFEHLLTIDTDGELFLDFLKIGKVPSKNNDFWYMHKKLLINILEDNFPIKEQIANKLNWTINYFNRTCHEYKKEDYEIWMPSDNIIDEEVLAKLKKSLKADI